MRNIDEKTLSKTKRLFRIAQRHFGITTLETRNQDCLDHQDVSVWAIRDALEAAYQAGRDSK